MRDIRCITCGKFKPTPPEDAARNLFPRYVRGTLKVDCQCDLCGTELKAGMNVVAITIPKDSIGPWEHHYIAF